MKNNKKELMRALQILKEAINYVDQIPNTKNSDSFLVRLAKQACGFRIPEFQSDGRGPDNPSFTSWLRIHPTEFTEESLALAFRDWNEYKKEKLRRLKEYGI